MVDVAAASAFPLRVPRFVLAAPLPNFSTASNVLSASKFSSSSIMDTNADDDEDSFSSVDEYRREDDDDAVFDEDVGGAKATTQDETDAAAVSANRADDIFTMMCCYRDWMEECVRLPVPGNDAEKKMRTRTYLLQDI